MRYFEAPNYAPNLTPWPDSPRSVFLAGGITNCSDWQKSITDTVLQHTNLIVFNPRRKNWTFRNVENEDYIQIEWEHAHLERADIHVYWFAPETLNPIVLFEYGKYLRSGKDLFVGVHPDYVRKRDVEIQTKIANSKIKIFYDLSELSTALIEKYK